MGNWVVRDREARQGTDGLSSGDITELKRLRAENAELRMERDVLKRSRGPVGKGGDEMSVVRFIAYQRTKYRLPHTLTRQDRTAPKFPDLLKRNFHVGKPNIKWSGDMTEIPT